MKTGDVAAWQKHYHSDPASLKRGEVTITRRGSRVLVAAPFNEDFRREAKRILGWRWRGAAKVWSFPVIETGELRELIAHVYGPRWVPTWMQEWRRP